MTSTPAPDDRPLHLPAISVVWTSLILWALYVVPSTVIRTALAMAMVFLHPTTNYVVWLVVTCAVGFGLLRRHGRYPSKATLALILGLAILLILALSVAVTLHYSYLGLTLTSRLPAFAFSAVAHFVVGATGLQLARSIYARRTPAR